MDSDTQKIEHDTGLLLAGKSKNGTTSICDASSTLLREFADAKRVK